MKGRKNIFLCLILLLSLFYHNFEISYADTWTIVVSGNDPQENPPIFEVCPNLLCSTHKLPNRGDDFWAVILNNPKNLLKKLIALDPYDYQEVESNVYNEALSLLAQGYSINFVGFSHGAQLVFRVVKQLEQYDSKQCIDRLITDDLVDFLYPLKGAKYTKVPKNVVEGFNIYQKLNKKPFIGKNPVKGATNSNVSTIAYNEWIVEPHSVYMLLHQWMEKSPEVHNQIKEFIEKPVGIVGTWNVQIKGKVCAEGDCDTLSTNGAITFQENYDYIDESYGKIGTWTKIDCHSFSVEYDKDIFSNMQKESCSDFGFDCEYNITVANAKASFGKNGELIVNSLWEGTLTIIDGGEILFSGQVIAKGKGIGNRSSSSFSTYEKPPQDVSFSDENNNIKIRNNAIIEAIIKSTRF